MTGRPRLEDEAEFIEQVRTLGIAGTARARGIQTGSVYERRERIEKRTGQTITIPDHRGTRAGIEYRGRLTCDLADGVVLIGSDCHYWNLAPSPAHRAFVKLCKELKPAAVILNGDVLDGATISRHPPINWEERPSLIQEIEACQDRLAEIMSAAPKAKRLWSLGNHDGRFEVKLATVAPEFARIKGVHLKDHFPHWEPCWSVWINDVVVKHRFRGGIHAVWNNTLHSGKSIVTGHLHSLKVTPFTDYAGTRFGVDCGTMADTWGPQFEYLEDNPRNWRSGFVVLTFRRSRLMWPEVVHVLDEQSVEFRGEIIRV